MNKADIARHLTLRFQGEAIRDHSISIRLFTKALDSVQKLLLHLTESRLDKQPRTQGRSSASLAAECELFLTSLEANCVTAHLALPEKEESLFPDLPDLSEHVLVDARDCFKHYSKGAYAPFEKLCPNPIHRRQVFSDLAGIAPGKESDHSVNFIGNDRKDHALYSPPRERIRKMIRATLQQIPDTVEEPRFVAAKGMAVMKGSNIVEWKETYDVLELDLEAAWRPKHISWGDCHLSLKHPIAVSIEDQSDGLFIATHDQLEIHAFGSSREEAMEAFAQEFTVLWQEIAKEADDNLTPDALLLKRKLRSLVDSEGLV